MTFGLLEALKSSQALIESPWDEGGLKQLATRALELPARSAWLINADAKLTWLRWMAEGFIPANAPDTDVLRQKATILQHVSERIRVLYPLLSTPERRQLTRLCTQIALSVQPSSSKRSQQPKKIRQALLDSAGSRPRCYLCGARFSKSAIGSFMGSIAPIRQNRLVIDFVFPRGLKSRDERIVIEHVRPISLGGSDNDINNLRLACDFCNSIKSDALTLFAKGQYGPLVQHPILGAVHPPNPYWVVRLLAVDGNCSECGRTAVETQLVAGVRTPLKFMNPVNLEVFCELHDPLESVRWIERRFLGGSIT